MNIGTRVNTPDGLGNVHAYPSTEWGFGNIDVELDNPIPGFGFYITHLTENVVKLTDDNENPPPIQAEYPPHKVPAFGPRKSLFQRLTGL